MKTLTIEVSDNYSDVICFTAIGRNGVSVVNVSLFASEYEDGAKFKIDHHGMWIKEET